MLIVQGRADKRKGRDLAFLKPWVSGVCYALCSVSPCYVLNMKCLLQAHGLNAWFQLVVLGGFENFEELWRSWRKKVIDNMLLRFPRSCLALCFLSS
jgi:hypothetical protein